MLWSITATALVVAAALLILLYRRRRHKQERLQLRLLAGRSHLLGEELDQAAERLSSFVQEDLAAQPQAQAALDQLHMALLERQAHLQTCDELTRLQQRKLALLATSWLQEAKAPAAPVRPAPPPPPVPRPAPPPVVQNRQQAENQLLRKIEELQKRQKEQQRTPPPPPKKSGPSPQR